jgi:hypothetical protein
MAIVMVSKVGGILHHRFVCYRSGGHWGNTEQVLPDGGI